MPFDPRGWVPVRLEAGETGITCRWQFVGSEPFREPFFEETLARCLSLPENSFGPARRSSVAELIELAAAIPALEPTAFIFHTSRCGSTLVSQFLGLDPSCITLAEVPIFDQILRARFQPALRDLPLPELLTAALRLHGQMRRGDERRLFVKMDSWHIGFQAEWRALFPRTPCLLLYRDPAGILRSQRRQAGMHAVRGLIEGAVFGFGPEMNAGPPAEYLPAVLEFYYRSFLEMARRDEGCALLAYAPQLIPAIRAALGRLGLAFPAAHWEEMERRSAFHSKRPDESFVEAAGDAVVVPPACAAAYAALEESRAASASSAA